MSTGPSLVLCREPKFLWVYECNGHAIPKGHECFITTHLPPTPYIPRLLHSFCTLFHLEGMMLKSHSGLSIHSHLFSDLDQCKGLAHWCRAKQGESSFDWPLIWIPSLHWEFPVISLPYWGLVGVSLTLSCNYSSFSSLSETFCNEGEFFSLMWLCTYLY